MKNTSKMFIALGVGFVMGGLLGVLFAPDKGSVTRDKIADSGKKLADKFNRKVKEGKEKADGQLSKINDMVEELV